MAPLEEPQVAAWGEANKPKVSASEQFLDAELATRPFIAGEDFSIADITALAAIDFMKPARLERSANLVHFNRWYAAVSARPSTAA